MTQRHSIGAALSRFLDRAATGRIVIATAVLFFFYIGAVLPGQAKKVEEYAGEVATPDSAFFYTASDIYASAAQFGPDGRSEYVLARATFDVAWPLVYALFLSMLLSWLLRRCYAEGDRRRLLNLLPWVALVFDYLENFSAAVTVARFPAKTPVLADLATVFTMLKWVTLSSAFVLAIAFAVVAFRRRTQAVPVPS